MKKIITLGMFALFSSKNFAQLTLPPSGDNQKCSVSQWIGPVEVNISYSSPDVHGPDGSDRTGHIWGELVPYGFTDQGFGTSKAAPWRAGANENTTIRFSHDVKVEGKELKAGTYGFFIDVEKDGPWTIIFSTNSESWGSFFYKESEDALRVKVNAKDADYTEWLTFGFEDRQPSSAIAFLQWEKKKVSFKIEVPNVNDIYLAKIKNELQNSQGFSYQNWMNAAYFCVNNKTHLEDGLVFADAAISMPFIGVENFATLQTKAMVLDAMGKKDEAEKIMQKAVTHPTARVFEIHQYAKRLLAEGKKEKALEMFKLNRQKHPEDTFVTYVGLARGYAANNDKKTAIKNWELAIKNLPADQKAYLPQYEAELKKLKEN